LGPNAEFWFDDIARERLLLVGGYPTMFRQFVVNVLAHDAREDIFALPMTSTAAARVLKRLNVVADAIYIDAGHEEEEVRADMALYYELLRPGGVLIGDDYHSRWSGVVRAVDGFAARRRLEVTLLGAKRSKWWLTKP
jgi:predicted O-methyltransferase YrrM